MLPPKMKKIRVINKLLKDKELMTKVYLYFSSTTYGDDYDPYEDNVTYANLNPAVIKAYVRELTPETAFWKQYGLHQGGMKEILCDERYRKWFENAVKIEIDSITYQMFKAGGGSNTSIVKRPNKLIRVIVSRRV